MGKENQPPAGQPRTAVAKRQSAPLDRGLVRRVLDDVAAGTSLRAACRAAGDGSDAFRLRFLRAVERNPALRDRFTFAIAARAHAIADSILPIADGTDDEAPALAEQIAAAVAVVAPQHVPAVTAAVLRERTARDRLRCDMRRWAASRLLPTSYGESTQIQHGGSVTHTVRVVHDALPGHLLNAGVSSDQAADAEWTIAPDDESSGRDVLDEPWQGGHA